MVEFPDFPDVPEEQCQTAEVTTRYEDITQMGRLKLDAIPHALDETCWAQLLGPRPLGRVASEHGVVPILSRISMRTGEGPIAVARPLRAQGRYQLGHTVDDAGQVDRLLLNMFCTLEGRCAKTHGRPPANAGELMPVGRVHAEHVFTRPFGSVSDRKVLAFPEGYGLPTLPSARLPWVAPSRVTVPPETAKRLDREPVFRKSSIVFGMGHTDSNQHVNSLVYPRFFEEAALERLDELGRPTDLFAVEVDVAYRKPCFAGQRVRVQVQALEHEGRLGAVGIFVPEGEDRRPLCYVQIWFEGRSSVAPSA